MKQRLPGKVGHKKRSCPFLSAEPARPELAFLVSVKNDPHMLQGDNILAGFLSENLNGVLVAEIITAFHRFEGMVFPVVSPVGQGGVNAALRGIGMTAHRMHFCHDSHRSPLGMRGDGGPHAGQAGPNDEHIIRKGRVHCFQAPMRGTKILTAMMSVGYVTRSTGFTRFH